MRRKTSPRARLAACIVLVGTVTGCEPEPTPPTDQGLVPDDVSVVTTPYGKWSTSGVIEYVERFDAQDLRPQVPSHGGVSPSATDRQGTRLRPIIENLADLRLFLSIEESSDTDLFSLYQEVPGFPDGDRFKDPKYDVVREAFTPNCIESAKAEIASLDVLATHLRNSSEFSLSELARSDYDLHCLTPLDQVPEPIRRVAGLLTVEIAGRSTPICSATAIGERSVITARHCFFSADTGRALRHFARLQDGLVSIVFFADNGGFRTFSVRLTDSATASQVPFFAFEDVLALGVVEKLDNWASSRSRTLTRDSIPYPTWIVGRNEVVADATRLHGLLDLVRGSGPNSCAVIDVTERGCLYHTCQTGKTTSGAGVLVLNSSGSVEILGVHKGAISRGAGCELDVPSARINLAAPLAAD